ncbi:N-acyl-phosphatidylethanolamine-hydrolyzing phospholipase D [Roridomyces roridus]|uniref:N-acyl-phosphatidylethanolamine-hydrolyzing phospholipase D n=1 Tax=Roridomyces roridus TaxID=1738132 RepID=A0AAD7AYD8_9AGAR|nr:N-acyl-phosphatidylethanolamine-hydrolyzing phospholipase D [Roridomyces roridus]
MTIQVSETPAQVQARTERQKLGKPSHWVHDKPTQFDNPWPSFRYITLSDFKDVLPILMNKAPSKETIAKIPTKKPTWGAEVAENAGKIKATWLGHACFLVELPSSTLGVRGARILFDPVFSDRCSPSQIIGPKRFTPPPCSLEDVPEFDAIVISHNHYDHMDTTTLQNLFKRPHAPHVFAPIGNASYFRDLGDARRVTTDVSSSQKVEFDITFTPGQHFTGHGIFDRFKTLWGGWVVEGVASEGTGADEPQAKVYFGGDTGYRTVPSSSDEGPETLPVCPAFKEIGERWGGFDFAMIPIGGYSPRGSLSTVHCAPRDSVALFKDIKARRALGMHWGTWILTSEPVLEPPELLATECAKVGIKEGRFGVCGIEETLEFDVGAKDEA